ncbi:hypothetical protein [Streptomyces sp. NPDC020141]|uniref:hypothetical protein n=1 Tax=Streptomyces sp. NPDC020141 TaxID=3365065 RepID=UPI0037B088EB
MSDSTPGPRGRTPQGPPVPAPGGTEALLGPGGTEAATGPGGTGPGTAPGAAAAPAASPEPAAASPEPFEPAAPAPLGVPRPPTGDAGVDALTERLAEVDHLPAGAHPAVYEDVHRGLRSTLASLDADPAAAPASGAPSPSPSYDHRS